MDTTTDKVTLADGRERVRFIYEDGRKSYWWHSRHRAREITSSKHRAEIDAAIARATPCSAQLATGEKR
ncbi:hypothetical protein [Burkholderia territorii]|uniref:hypothetical protein n=1 Tax=Burkholderia territorii TaxID=1503055 RepID=UPI0009BEA11A|nr:hypothetical protein [Burkholderia territorii]